MAFSNLLVSFLILFRHENNGQKNSRGTKEKPAFSGYPFL